MSRKEMQAPIWSRGAKKERKKEEKSNFSDIFWKENVTIFISRNKKRAERLPVRLLHDQGTASRAAYPASQVHYTVCVGCLSDLCNSPVLSIVYRIHRILSNRI